MKFAFRIFLLAIGLVSLLGAAAGRAGGLVEFPNLADHAPCSLLGYLARPDTGPSGMLGSHSDRAGPVRPTSVMPRTDDTVWYQLYFQEPGVAEAELDHNVRTSFRMGRINVSGNAPPRPEPFGMVPRQGGLFARVPPVPPPLPAWLTEADIEYYTSEFTRTGFRGGLNWYRNIDRNWELLAPFDGVPVSVPALYIAGDRDPVVKFPGMDRHIADLPKFAPQLRDVIMLPGCGHITQEERPAEVSAAMIDFIRHLP